MRKFLAAAVLAAFVAAAVQAQTAPVQGNGGGRPPVRGAGGRGGYPGHGYGTGSGYGYGGYGYGHGHGCGGYPGGGGAYWPLPPRYGGWWGGLGYGFNYGSSFGEYSYYYGALSAPYYGSYGWDYNPPPPAPVEPRRPAVSPAAASAKAVEEGRRCLKEADYKGAVDSFREAVTADFGRAAPQAWFALALAVSGDYRNADKALRSAAGGAPFEKIDFRSLFKDARECDRVRLALTRPGGAGSLAVAWLLALDGDPFRLKQMAEKDAAAKKLLP